MPELSRFYRIIDCKHLPPYRLQLKFDDGLERVVDLENILEGQIYGPLRDEELFSKVVMPMLCSLIFQQLV